MYTDEKENLESLQYACLELWTNDFDDFDEGLFEWNKTRCAGTRRGEFIAMEVFSDDIGSGFANGNHETNKKDWNIALEYLWTSMKMSRTEKETKVLSNYYFVRMYVT